MAASAEDKRVFSRACEVFGSVGKVHRYGDDDGDRPLDMLSCNDVPTNGVTSYSTIGLSTKLQQWESGDGVPFGAELCGACASDAEDYPNLLVTSAYYALRDSWALKPGVVHPGIFQEYEHEISQAMKHLYLVSPYLWDPTFDTLEHPDSLTVWLQAVPISEKEYEFFQEFGSARLDAHLQQHEIDVFNINRPCSFTF